MSAQHRKIGLGKGLSALLDDTEEVMKKGPASTSGQGSVKDRLESDPAVGQISTVDIDKASTPSNRVLTLMKLH